MHQNDVSLAFDMVLEEIDKAISAINQEGIQAFQDGKYDVAHELSEKGKQIKAFRERVKNLQQEWLNLFAPIVPHKPRHIKQSYPLKLQRGLKTPEREYRIPILQALVELGGSATMNEVLERVHNLMRHRLSNYDYQSLPSDPSTQRWQNTAQWARYRMVTEGLLSSNSPRGVWEITESGRKFLEQFK
jgi:hypothetical protein